MYLLSPCLLLYTLGSGLTVETLSGTATAVIWSCVQLCVGLIVGYSTRKFARAEDLEGVYLISCTWGNSVSLPLLLLTSLVGQGSLREDKGAFQRAVSYCFSYTIPWWFTIYSVSFEIIRKMAVKGVELSPLDDSFYAVVKRTLSQPPVAAVFIGIIVGLTPIKYLFWGEKPLLEGMGSVIQLLGQGSVPCANVVLAGSLHSAVSSFITETRRWMGEEGPQEGTSFFGRVVSLSSLIVRALRRYTTEAEAGATVHDRPVILVEEDASTSVSTAIPSPSAEVDIGKTSNDSGSEVVRTVVREEESSGIEALPKAHQLLMKANSFFSFHTTSCLLLSRLVLVPAINFLFFKLAQDAQMPMLTSSDPVLTLVILLQACMPSAQTLLIVTSNLKDERGSKALSFLFIVMYPLSCVTLLPWLMAAISMSGA